ncbi:MAG: helix-turn-helix domain-containing protein [Proteobacteria bacterium]|nr:helix-turn-helix domain-containing protein [Pseudomonadota bacterium]
MKELKRYKILQDVISKKLPLTQGARIMGISYRQALRLKKRFLERGVEGIISKHRQPHNNILQLRMKKR